MKVSVSNSAYADLESMQEYYSAQGVPAVGIEFVVSIIEQIQTLSEHPNKGQVVPEFEQEHIRELIHPPFLIVYLREKNCVQIIRVWRSERLLRLSADGM